eukprot:gene7296-8484_t
MNIKSEDGYEYELMKEWPLLIKNTRFNKLIKGSLTSFKAFSLGPIDELDHECIDSITDIDLIYTIDGNEEEFELNLDNLATNIKSMRLKVDDHGHGDPGHVFDACMMPDADRFWTIPTLTSFTFVAPRLTWYLLNIEENSVHFFKTIQRCMPLLTDLNIVSWDTWTYESDHEFPVSAILDYLQEQAYMITSFGLQMLYNRLRLDPQLFEYLFQCESGSSIQTLSIYVSFDCDLKTSIPPITRQIDSLSLYHLVKDNRVYGRRRPDQPPPRHQAVVVDELTFDNIKHLSFFIDIKEIKQDYLQYMARVFSCNTKTVTLSIMIFNNLNECDDPDPRDDKKNFTLERDIRNLDKKIALLIKNRITLDEIMQSSGDILEMQNRTITIKDKSQRENYGQLFYLLQNNTTYIASLARLVKVGEIDNLLQTVMFTLYGNQYEENEEHLLLSMFQKVLAEEFKEATSIGSLLRANTALTRMMTTYTRRGPGQQYLKQSLTRPLEEITANAQLSLEINPSTVYENYINEYETRTGKPSPLKRKAPPEECAVNPNVIEIITPRAKQLVDIGDRFIESIIGSIDAVPYGIRWICRQIRELVKSKFPTATRAQTCGLIGGFFLLRYINPAVVSPQAFMLVDAKLSNNTKKNLTYPAKMMQNLANNVMFGGVKEFFMEPLNVFLDKNKDRLNDFLENLTRVDNLSDHLNLDKYIALGRAGADISINITLNEMYFVHSLLEQHINLLAPESNDPLRMILADLGPAPAQLPRQENANVELKLTNRLELNDSLNIKPEQMYNETKYLLFTVLRSLASNKELNQIDMGATLAEVAKHAAANKNQEIVDSIKKILINFKKLSHEGYLTEEDNYSQLRKDIVAEMLNYESYISKTSAELEKLKQVLEAIREHNQFLQQQLESYEKYLVNVRENCNSSGPNDKKSSKKEKKEKKDKSVVTKKKGPFKFSYSQLEKDGIILESEVPEDRRSNIFFSFSSSSPGIFDVVLIYRTTTVHEIKLHLDTLLEMQVNNELQYEADFFKLHINLLLHLINKTFMS